MTTRGERWFAVGRSRRRVPAEAGQEAAAAALAGADPALLVVFASDAHDPHELLRGVAAANAAGAPVVGCTTAGEIATDGPGDAGVVVAALGGGFCASVAAGRDASADLRAAGAGAAAGAADVAGAPHRVLLLLSDGLAGDQQEVVRGAHGVVGAEVPLVGGCAGDDLRMRSTHQFLGTEVLTDAVVGAAIGSPAPLGIGVRHGWRRVGEPMLVTASDGNRVLELEGRPALDAYLERLGAPPDATADGDAFTRFALTHPLGLARRTGEEQARFIGGADLETRVLNCIAAVPQGGLAWIMEGDEGSVLDATTAACRDAAAPLPGRPLGLLAFDCIARRGVLGDAGIREEVARIVGDNTPVAGFYTYGEIARTRGVRGFHNQTLVVLAVG